MDQETQERIARLEQIAISQEERIQQNEVMIAELKAQTTEIKLLNKQVAGTIGLLAEHAQIVEDRLEALHAGQEHTDKRLDAVIDIVSKL